MTDLHRLLGDRLLRDEPLARYTAARLGGPAEWLYVARGPLDELARVAEAAWAAGLPLRVLGGGSNVLVSERGVRGLVVINHAESVEFGEWHGGRRVAAASGTGLVALARRCQRRGLAGLEWAVSVPGTVGGAVVNNAGAHGGDIAASLRDAVVLEPDGPRLLAPADMAYAYRHSSLKARADRRFVVLLAQFALAADDPAAIQARMDDYSARRKQTQPPGASLGSIFKNPPGDYAGRLIEAAGLKGFQIGGAQVARLHANFFINSGGAATASDYYALVEHVRAVVAQKTGVVLEPEIELVGDWF